MAEKSSRDAQSGSALGGGRRACSEAARWPLWVMVMRCGNGACVGSPSSPEPLRALRSETVPMPGLP